MKPIDQVLDLHERREQGKWCRHIRENSHLGTRTYHCAHDKAIYVTQTDKPCTEDDLDRCPNRGLG